MMPLDAKLTRPADISVLEATWRDLESRADRAFFLSWTWIGSWLGTFADEPWLIEITDASSRVIGLGLFCEARETRKKIIRAKQMRLHETGNPDHDVITIEYNTILAERGMEEAVWFAALKALNGKDAPHWDELIVGGSTDADQALLSRMGLRVHRRAETTSAWVDLAALREKGITDADGYLATLGKSTRSQIRRSMKLYRERGELSLDVAGSLDEAKAFLAELGPHHEAKWNAAGQPGATQKTEYMRFHAAMMERAYGSDTAKFAKLSAKTSFETPASQAPQEEVGVNTGQQPHPEATRSVGTRRMVDERHGVEFLRARAGEHAFGWLYNFVDRGRVLFYLSGFAFEEDNRLKPGLVTHALAVEYHLRGGMDVYDFMGGDNRYKKNLGQPGPDVVAYALQRRTLPMVLEGLARGLKARLGR